MTSISVYGRLLGFSACVLTFFMLSCADTTNQSPVAPSQGAARVSGTDAPQVETFLTDDSNSLNDEPLAEQAKAKSCTVRGTTIAGAKVTVTCPGAKPVSVTSPKGTFEFKNLPLKKCTVTFSHTSYTAPSRPANCVTGGTVTVKFVPAKKKPPTPPKGVPCAQCLINRNNKGIACQNLWEATHDYPRYQECIQQMYDAYDLCRFGPPRCIQ